MTHEMLDAVLVHEWEKKVFHIKRWCYREINTLANIFTMSVKCLEIGKVCPLLLFLVPIFRHVLKTCSSVKEHSVMSQRAQTPG